MSTAPRLVIVKGGPSLQRSGEGKALSLRAAGTWTAPFAPSLERLVADAEKLAGQKLEVSIDVSQISKLDTFGAWLIERLRRSFTSGSVEARIDGLSANYASLVDEVRRVTAAPDGDATTVTITGMLNQI